MAECLHFIDVEGIPVKSADELTSFYQAVSSLILANEVMLIVSTNSHFMFLINVGRSEHDSTRIIVICDALRNPNVCF